MLCRRRRRPFRRGGGASSPCSVIVVAAATTTTIPVVTYLSLQSFVGITTSRTRTNSTMDMHAEFRTFCCCFTATESSTSAWHNTHHAPSQPRSVAGGFPTQAHPSCRGCCLLSVTRRKAVAVRQQTLPATDQKWAVCSVRLGLSLGAKLIPGIHLLNGYLRGYVHKRYIHIWYLVYTREDGRRETTFTGVEYKVKGRGLRPPRGTPNIYY